MSKDLECCPFCGGEADFEEVQGGQAVNFDPVYRAQCLKCCRMDFPYRSWKSDAISDWNCRATPPAPAPDGSVMVPREATPEMIRAARHVVLEGEKEPTYADVYSAMISAAPTTEAPNE